MKIDFLKHNCLQKVNQGTKCVKWDKAGCRRSVLDRFLVLFRSRWDNFEKY